MGDSVRSGQAKPYADPYVAGVTLGLVLLTAFVLVGRGLGASGAFASVAASAVDVVSPATARSNFFFSDHIEAGRAWRDWLVVELAGVCVGAWISAALARRLRMTIERGEHASVRGRITAAAGGGAVMGVGAVLARGCTSGQALTGGALLSVGSWLFVMAAFAAAYVVAFVRRGAWS